MKPATSLPVSEGRRQLQTRRATIVSVLHSRRVEVQLAEEMEPQPAVVAVYGYDDPSIGDEVLALLEGEEVVVIGVIRALRDVSVEQRSQFEARDVEGRLLFRHDPETGLSEVFVDRGDLRFRVSEGRLSFEARDGVTIGSDEKVEVRSGRGVELKAGPRRDEERAAVVVNPDRIGASAAELLVAAGRAQLVASQAFITAEHLKSKVTRVQQVARVIETRAHRIVENTRFSYREVERLAQLKAARIRSVAKTSAQILGERILVRAKRDAKIRGEKIYLA